MSNSISSRVLGDSKNGRRSVARLAVVGALVIFVGGCSAVSSGSLEAEEGRWPPRPPEVDVSMYDFGFEFDRPIPAGRVVFRVRNTGTVRHRVTLVPLPEDMPPIDEQLRSDERRGVHPLGAIKTREPGDEGVFAVDLEEGRRYALVCYEKDDQGIVHARKGGNAEFRAGGPDAGPADQPP